MDGSKRSRSYAGDIDLWMTVAAIALAILMIFAATQMQAQTSLPILTMPRDRVAQRAGGATGWVCGPSRYLSVFTGTIYNGPQ